MKQSIALSVAKQGFQAAMRRAAYEGNIGQWHYAMDRDEWSVKVTDATGRSRTFQIKRSWEV